MATDNGSTPDVNDVDEQDDRIAFQITLLGSRFEKAIEICAIEDMRKGDFVRYCVERVLSENGWTQDAAEDAAIETQLKRERKEYAAKLAAKKAAKSATSTATEPATV